MCGSPVTTRSGVTGTILRQGYVGQAARPTFPGLYRELVLALDDSGLDEEEEELSTNNLKSQIINLKLP